MPLGEIQAVQALFSVLPTAVEALCKVDEITRAHDEKMSLKYSQQEFLNGVYHMYRAGKISAQEAKKAVELVYRQAPKTIEANVDPIEAEIRKLLSLN